MSSQKGYFLSFLENINPVAAHNAKKMEELIFEDPSSSIVKARLFAEEVLNQVFKIDKIEAPYLSSLHEKINYLSREGYIKREIQKSFDTIRLSGNKAAHDGKFNDITEAFKLHKEMYKIGVWFYEVYSSDHLKLPIYDTPKPRENIEDIVQKKILELLGMGTIKPVQDKNILLSDSEMSEIQKDGSDSITLNRDLEQGQSYLLRELNRLKDSSQEAVENASQFSEFKDYLHVKRKIQEDLESILESNHQREKGNLILLCGSVGDGKSHLLAYLKENKPEIINEYTILNDATESFSPNKNAMETLEEILKDFSDEKIEKSTEKIILAINMGVLHNFINMQHSEYSYNKLKSFVTSSALFTQSITSHFSDQTFDLLSFADYHSFEISESGPVSSFYSSLLEKIFNPSNENPFYLAMQEDEKNEVHTMIHENYRFMQNKFVKDQVVQVIIQTIIKRKLVISARAFLNFISDILIPDEIQNINFLSELSVLKYSLPNLLFNRGERSSILQAVNQIDPIHRRSIFIDQLIVELNTLNDWSNILKEYIFDETSKSWLKPFDKNSLTDHSFNLFLEAFIRIAFLTNKKFSLNIEESSYKEYMHNLYYFNTGDKNKIIDFYEEVKKAIFNWKGSPKKNYIYLNKPVEKFRLAQKLHLKPNIQEYEENRKESLGAFKSSIVLMYIGNHSEKIVLEIDFPLFQLLSKVQEGYRPNKKDEEDAIKFVEFVEKLMSLGDKKKEMLVYFPSDNRFYMIKRNDYGLIGFERE
ncbi:DNA phosphorothioation-dependent restriction protein DptF [Peribacillus simplex]|uniref:DNA phosphorothioation-dependent restriction protein DptF n=1 Tax=Peribacillus simplex TaxID=1478 RepID=UPI002989C3A1|nr:DNA phosphorothioation-dependent restriction protein DptF [Peribacillus simplex]MBX9955708.1 DNA phosphorothioation-dependent restriction protein DptF [Peribacillus simplex]